MVISLVLTHFKNYILSEKRVETQTYLNFKYIFLMQHYFFIKK
jgi:hypothetical protein